MQPLPAVCKPALISTGRTAHHHPPTTVYVYMGPNPCRYYSALGPRMLSDVLDLAGQHVDCVKFAGGCFTVMPEAAVRAITELCHKHQVHCLQQPAAAT
jgi:phosphosulfolactate synthase (CoM biosynthesis protein A)